MKSRRQALQPYLDTAVVVVIQVFNEFLFEVFHRLEFLQIEQFAFEQTKEIFYHSIVRTVSFPVHTLANTFLPEHALILLVLVLTTLVGMEDKLRPIRYFVKSLVQHSDYHAQHRPV